MPHSLKLAHVNQTPCQTKERRRFLVVEDEHDLADLISMHLSNLDATVNQCHRGDDALALALKQHWDLIVLDLSLPAIDGLDICRELRGKGLATPILMLTSRSTELDRVLGLELGADDYLCKPFSILEFKARVKALLRRSALHQIQPESSDIDCRINELYVNRINRKVIVAGAPVDLTAKEFDLLWHFVSRPGQVFRRSELLDAVWGYGHDGYEHTVNSHINRLRAKIEHNPSQPKYLLTVWGVGYKFAEHSSFCAPA